MGRRWLWGLGGLALLGGGVVLACGPIALRVMRAGAERNFAADLAAELPDGLHVVLCGAGGPLPDPVRSGPCTVVIAGSSLFVVDAGSGGARNLLRMGLPAGRIEALFVTHVHSDHIDGLGELALQRWVGGSNTSPPRSLATLGRVTCSTPTWCRRFRCPGSSRSSSRGCRRPTAEG